MDGQAEFAVSKEPVAIVAGHSFEQLKPIDDLLSLETCVCKVSFLLRSRCVFNSIGILFSELCTDPREAFN
jgi:hypothetical protein